MVPGFADGCRVSSWRGCVQTIQPLLDGREGGVRMVIAVEEAGTMIPTPSRIPVGGRRELAGRMKLAGEVGQLGVSLGHVESDGVLRALDRGHHYHENARDRQ
jgi:hypothetical protein